MRFIDHTRKRKTEKARVRNCALKKVRMLMFRLKDTHSTYGVSRVFSNTVTAFIITV